MLHFLSSFVLYGEGFITGVILTIMVGPVTMVILKYGIEVNKSAGIWTAAGTWFSDLIFITGTYLMTKMLNDYIQQPSVRLGIYVVGGCVLMLFGLMMALNKKRASDNHLPPSVNYSAAFVSGFLVNSFSPATFFFWMGAAILLRLQNDPPIWYYLGVMSALAIGDYIKASIAPKLNAWIHEKYLSRVQVIAGVLIALAGIYMIISGALKNELLVI